MQIYQRRAVAALFYSINLAILVYSLRCESLWQFYTEPVVLIMCFVSLGFIASDFLTPSLSQISRGILHISDRVSGLTLLAMGNAIPDITSTYQAMNAGATSLAIGELLGGIFFLLTVVLGSMTLIKPIELKRMDRLSYSLKVPGGSLDTNDSTSAVYNRQLFLQDVSIFAVLILLSIYFLHDGRLMAWECVVMILAYCGYAMFLILDHNRDKLVPPNSGVIAESENVNNMTDISTVLSNPEALDPSQHGNMILFNEGIKERRANIRKRIRQYLRVNYNRWVRITLKDFLDIWENEAYLQNQEDLADAAGDVESQVGQDCISSLALIRRTTSWQGGDCPRDIPKVCSTRVDNHSIAGNIDSSEPQENNTLLSVPAKRAVCKSLSCDHLPDLRSSYSIPSPLSFSSHETIECQSQVTIHRNFKTWVRSFRLSDYLADGNTYLPATEFTMLLITTPIAILLNILIPVDSHSKNDQEFHLFDVVRLSLVPATSTLLLTEECPLWVFAMCFLLFVILTVRWYKSIVRHNMNFRAVAVFVLSLCAISSSVHMVVNVLMEWGEKFNISNTILGLTVFAWGNSLGDLVSNIIFVEIGVLDIALGACFGSPLLYFLFGIGVDGLMLMMNRKNDCGGSRMMCEITFQVDSHLGLSGLGVFMAFVILGVVVPINGWRIDKKVSISLLMLYVIITTINIYKEIS